MQKVKVMGMVAMAVIIFFTAMPVSAWEPLGYPWETYGEATIANGVERGFKLDGWVEQGIDWLGFGRGNKWVLNTFVQPHLILSDNQSQWWNNKTSVYVGVKVLNRDINLGSRQQWGKLTFGIRGEFNYYLDGGAGRNSRDDMRGVVFMQWTAGGDLKKR